MDTEVQSYRSGQVAKWAEDASTFGLLGEADQVLGDNYEDPRFLSPGAPRAAWGERRILVPITVP